MNLLNAVTIPAADGDKLNPGKGLLTTSSLVAIEGKVQAGATPPNAGAIIKIIVASSKYDIDASAAPGLLQTPVAALVCELNLSANGSACFTGSAFVAPGDYLYCWLSTRKLGQPVTLTLDANERI